MPELDLTEDQEKRRRQIERRLQKVLVDLRDLAVEAGCQQPSLFYECEGWLNVFDAARGDCDGDFGSRQDKVTLSISTVIKGVPMLGCGAW